MVVQAIPGSDDERQARAARLSALMDGEAGADEAQALGHHWRDDADLRATWHAWHLAADVMRSDDLAVAPGHDEVFLQKLRARLADEPVVFAPAVPVAPAVAIDDVARRRRGWLAPAAAAAGFMVVAGAILVLRMPADGGASDRLAAAAPSAAGPMAVANVTVGSEAAMLRDARLDRYFEAHRRIGASALVVPAATMQARPVEAMVVESR